MATVANINGVKVRQHPLDHPPPHVHLVRGAEDVQITIADRKILRGQMKGGVPKEVLKWLEDNAGALALNWVLTLSGLPPRRIQGP